jgi:hypothetical protein
MKFNHSISRYMLLLLLPFFAGVGGCVESGAVEVEENSLRSSFWLSKSRGGEEASIFESGERIYFNHRIVNIGIRNLAWSLSDIRPTAEFRVLQGNQQMRSSFDSVAFAQKPITGTLQPGDTLAEDWGRMIAASDLPPGRYLARAVPTISPGGIQVSEKSIVFEVR